MSGFLFYNFLAADRKRNLIPFNYFSPGDSISWIASNDPGVTLTSYNLVGLVNGQNLVFTVPFAFVSTCLILKNGIVQSTPQMYTQSSLTVTFNRLFVPQTGDLMQCLIS